MLIGAMMSHLAKIIVTPFLYKWTTDYVAIFRGLEIPF